MILKLKSEFPSTSLWYDTYSAQESLETKAMVYHGQVGGEGQLNLSQTVFFSIFSFYFFILLFVFLHFFYPITFFILFLSLIFFFVLPMWKDIYAYLRLFFFFIFFILLFILLCFYLIAFPFVLFLFRSPMVKWAVKDNQVYLRLFASLCNPLCAVIKEWWHWWRF